MTHRDGFPRLSARSAWRGDAGHRKPCAPPKALGRPKALGSRRSGRAGEPAAGESVGASESLDHAPHRPRLSSYPPGGPSDRLPDPYGSTSTTFGINRVFADHRHGRAVPAPAFAFSPLLPQRPYFLC